MPDEPLLSDVISRPTLNWRSKRITTSLSRVPSAPGLYAFGMDQKTCLGLDAERIYVYIGETGNLRQRLEQHQPRRETNERLKEFLLEHRNVAYCWFCPLPKNLSSRKERLKLEKRLIQFFNPGINTHGKL